jgi:hypothetical protein
MGSVVWDQSFSEGLQDRVDAFLGDPSRRELLPLFVECGQCVYGARSAGSDQFFPSNGTRLTHKDRNLFVVELEHAWRRLDAVPEADT